MNRSRPKTLVVSVVVLAMVMVGAEDARALSLRSSGFSVPAWLIDPAGEGTVFEQLPDGDTSLASQSDACTPFVAECADDFTGDGSSIVAVSFWGYFWEPTPSQPKAFTIRFFAAAMGGGPGELLFEREVTEIASSGGDVIRYDASLGEVFETTAGATYYISIVAEHCSPPQWGWASAAGNAEDVYFRSDYFGYPEWTRGNDVFGDAYDLAFRLMGEPVPVSDVSWSLLKHAFR